MKNHYIQDVSYNFKQIKTTKYFIRKEVFLRLYILNKSSFLETVRWDKIFDLARRHKQYLFHRRGKSKEP